MGESGEMIDTPAGSVTISTWVSGRRRSIAVRGMVAMLGTIGIVVCSSGCESPPNADRAGFDSPHPSSRLFAAERAVLGGDQSAIPHLIDGLASDDPAVRFTSIHALERLTGQTYEYHYYQTPEHRQAAINRWILAYETGELKKASESHDQQASGHD